MTSKNPRDFTSNHGRHAATSTSNTKTRRPRARTVAIATALTAALAVPVGVGVAGAVAAPAPLVSDSFTRTVGSGFGSAGTGGAYTATNPSATSVASGTGVFTLKPGVGAATVLRSVSATDVTASAKFTVPTLPTKGSGVYAALQARINGSSHYEAVVRFTSSKAMTLLVRRADGSASTMIVPEQRIATGITAGKAYTLEFSVTGSSPVALKARVIPAGSTAGAWQANGTDASAKRLTSGSLAVWGYLSKASTAATLKVDDLVATAGAAATTPTTPTTPTTTPSTTPTKPTAPTATPAPAPTTQPTAPATPTNPDTSAPAQTASNGVSTSGARHSVGSAAIGSTRYAVPSGAVFAAAGAAAGGNGTQAKPYATAQAAISAAPSGATVVLRGGTYHETVTVPFNKKLIIQSYPGEAVWFDGSQNWGNWSASGSTWVSGGYTYAFNNSPSYSGNLSDASRYIDPNYPMAATPDQVFIDGVSQRQVASRSAVTAGTFYADKSAKQLVLGSNPNGHSVRVSTLQEALRIQGAGTTVRGIGFERYATSAMQMGTITAQVPGITLENLAIVDNATIGLFAWSTDATLRNLTIARNGMLGFGGNSAYGLKASGLLVADNNSEHFKREPISGGFKITRSRGISITDSAFLRNATTGLWLDESVYDAAVTGNDFVSNGGDGVEAEISAHVTIADNVARDNAGNGIRLFDTSDSAVWNNTSVRNGRNIALMQDARRETDLSVPGHDPKRPQPDPTFSWIVQNVTVSNNVLADATGLAQLTVEDQAHKLSGADMHLTINGNLYQRTVANKPSIDIVWMQTTTATKGYATAAAFAAATGQDTRSTSVTGTGTLTSGLTLTSSALSQVTSIARSLPASVASLVGQPAGTLHLGSW